MDRQQFSTSLLFLNGKYYFPVDYASSKKENTFIFFYDLGNENFQNIIDDLEMISESDLHYSHKSRKIIRLEIFPFIFV